MYYSGWCFQPLHVYQLKHQRYLFNQNLDDQKHLNEIKLNYVMVNLFLFPEYFPVFNKKLAWHILFLVEHKTYNGYGTGRYT